MQLRLHLPLLSGLLALLAVAFHPLWLQGHSLMASMGAPGVTRHGPAQLDAMSPVASPVPTADAVAANIDEPLAHLAHRQMANGELPLWNPHNGLGVPLLGNWQSAVWNPLRFLVQAAPGSSWSFDITYLLRLLVAGLGAALLARHLFAVSGSAMFAAGAVFGLSGYFIRYLQMHHLNGEVFLPWLLLLADRLVLRLTVANVLAFAGVVFCVIVGGNPQVTLVAAVTAGLFLLWRTLGGGWHRAGLTDPKLWVWLRLLITALPPLLISSAYWLSGLEYVRESVHHHDEDFGHDAYTAAGALGFFLPSPYQMPGAMHVVAPYFGFLPLVVALLARFRGSTGSLFLWGMFVFCAGKIAGMPGTGWLAEVPGFALMKTFKYLYPVPALCLALLCARGIERLHHEPLQMVDLRRALLLAACPLLLLLIAGWRAAASHPLIDLGASMWLGLGWRLVLVCALAMVLWHPAVRRFAAPAAALLVAGEMALATPTSWMPRQQAYERPPFVKFLQGRDPHRHRSFGVLGMLMPNQNAVFGIDDIRLHDGVFPARFGPFVQRFLDPNVRHWPVFTADDLGTLPAEQLAAGMELANLMLPQKVARDLAPSTMVHFAARTPARYLDLLNVRYLVLPRQEWMSILVEQFPKQDYSLVHEDRDALVVERKRALGRAFIPKRVLGVASMEEALDAMDRDDYQPAEVAYLEADVGADEQMAFIGAATVTPRLRGDTLEITAQATTPAWLVASIYPYPGLKAEVNGTEVPVVPANGMLSAVKVPAGRGLKVRFVYQPTYGRLAFWLALAGGLLLAFLVFRPAVRAGGRGRPPEESED